MSFPQKPFTQTHALLFSIVVYQRLLGLTYCIPMAVLLGKENCTNLTEVSSERLTQEIPFPPLS